jgi:TonB family protein
VKNIVVVVFFFLFAFGVDAQTPGEGPRIPQTTKSDTSKPSLSKIYTSIDVDKYPEYPGGTEAFFKFLSKNLKWPKGSEEAMGRVIVSFVIERDGHMSNFKIEKSLGKDLDEEAIRVLKLSPKWTPAVKKGYKVRVKYFVPISFEYNNE